MTSLFTEFWFDVGGTFTDCFALTAFGELRRHKLLSSGVTKGSISSVDAELFGVVDPARHADPDDFWIGYRFRLLDAGGKVAAERRVVTFSSTTGRFTLDAPLPSTGDKIIGRAYELSSGEESVVLAVRYLLGLKLTDPIPPVTVRLGTTRGTNALLTRRGARTAFVTTRGFADVLRIGYQNRPRLFDLRVVKPEPLFAEVLEVDERVAVDGTVLQEPDEAALRRDLAAQRASGIESLAVCLLHAYRFTAHEELIGRIAAEVGFADVSLSHRVAPLAKIVPRGDTTVVDAYLNPVLRDYVNNVRSALGNGKLRIMTSAGGLVAAEQFVGKDSILSGPAGGVVGMARASQAAGFPRAIGFDMGGTSTDVARFDGTNGGTFEMEYETEKAGVRIVAPMTSIHTVAAGGGSICWFDGVKLVVGPDSGGADPGPACYGRGGPLCVTDCNFYLGKILPERFPFPLDRRAVERRIAEIIEAVATATGKSYDPGELCNGFLQVANANMAKAIRAVSVAKGYDPRDYVLTAFGGAAGQHACAVARELGMTKVLIHPDAGLLSALGIGLADVVRHRVVGVYRPLADVGRKEIVARFAELIDEARREVKAEGIDPKRIRIRRRVDVRYAGVDAALTIEVRGLDAGSPPPTAAPADEAADLGLIAEAYEADHRRLYGYVQTGRPLELVALRVEAIGKSPEVDIKLPTDSFQPLVAADYLIGVVARIDGESCLAEVIDRSKLRRGHVLEGPVIVCEQAGTTIVSPGWRAEVLERGELLLTDQGGGAKPTLGTDCDPVQLEIFNNQFAAIAEQMGITLRNTSSSVNVKERLDFSCALFTARGELVVNAPHIPVHLGAMGETVRAVLADNPAMEPGDVFVTNDPYRGGSHLPDITVVTPVHDVASGELLFFTASRAHHAEIGGIRPGSMPPFSKNLAEEGVLIRNFKLVAAGRSGLDNLKTLLSSGPYPSRRPDDNLADVAAQVAANHQGARDLLRLIKRYSRPVVVAYMRHIRDAAEWKMRSALSRIPDGRYSFTDHLDDGTPITATITINADEAEIDFTGTGPTSLGNLNANRAIVTSAVMYVMRCLIDEDIPLNQGVLEPIRITLPECVLNPTAAKRAEDSLAVVGGNVETSQRTVDVLLGALGLAAASQGTMNNTLFGDATFGYYETVCGGNGATPAGPGADAIHTHMTNTRLTDAETLEIRYPVRLREFAIRRGSGGAGLHRGGDGIVRKIEFLRPLEVSLLTQRRGPFAPYGLNGGGSGALGRNTLIRRDGTIRELAGAEQFHAEAGDVLVVETPGGGGWGTPNDLSRH